MNINKFNIGDTIVRTERTAPTAYNPPGDGSYIGEKVTLTAIANGLIYLKTDPESWQLLIVITELDIMMCVFTIF